MPFRRRNAKKFRRRRRPRRRGTFRNRVARIARTVMPLGETIHYTESVHTSTAVTIKVPGNDSNVVELVRPDIQTRGDSVLQRTGTSIYVTSIQVRGRLSHSNAGDRFVRMSLAWFPAATLDAGFPKMYETLFGSASALTERRKMYFDKYYIVRQLGGSVGGSVNLNLKIPVGRTFRMIQGSDTSVGGQDHLSIRWCGDNVDNGSFKGIITVFFRP